MNKFIAFLGLMILIGVMGCKRPKPQPGSDLYRVPRVTKEPGDPSKIGFFTRTVIDGGDQPN